MSNPYKNALVYYAILSLIPLLILLQGVFFLKSGDEIGYCFLNYYIIMPLLSFCSGLFFTIKRVKMIWLHPIIFAAFILLIPYSVFHTVDFWFSLITVIPSIISILIGAIILRFKAKSN